MSYVGQMKFEFLDQMNEIEKSTSTKSDEDEKVMQN